LIGKNISGLFVDNIFQVIHSAVTREKNGKQVANKSIDHETKIPKQTKIYYTSGL
jgi:hypothetical protein